MPRVIIIGAGTAGIAAAAKLGSVDYVVLEARNRIGGRLHTLRSPIGPIELGAAWFHEVPDNPLADIARENNLDYVYDDDKTVMYDQNGPIHPRNLALIDSFTGWRLGAPEGPLDQTVSDYISSEGVEPVAAELLKNVQQFQQLPNGQDWTQLSSRYPNGQGRDMAIKDGYDHVLHAIGKNVPKERIHLEEPVTEVIVIDKTVTVITTKATYTADYVIVTAPIGVLKANDIKFSPPFPSHITKAIDSTSIAALGKVYVEFPSVFWAEDKLKYVITGPRPALVYNWHGVHDNNKRILGVIVSNDVIREIEAHPDRAFEIVKPYFQLIALPEEEVPEPTNVVSTTWMTDPYSKGAFSSYTLHNVRADAAVAFEQGCAPLFFAGEHTATIGATFVHGAYLSGQRAAGQVLAGLGKL